MMTLAVVCMSLAGLRDKWRTAVGFLRAGCGGRLRLPEPGFAQVAGKPDQPGDRAKSLCPIAAKSRSGGGEAVGHRLPPEVARHSEHTSDARTRVDAIEPGDIAAVLMQPPAEVTAVQALVTYAVMHDGRRFVNAPEAGVQHPQEELVILACSQRAFEF